MFSPVPQRVPNGKNVDSGNTPYRRANPPYCQLLTVNLHVTLCVCVCVCEQYGACVTGRSGAAAFVYVNLECPTVVHAIE